ncbi:sigma factor SigB regulation protein RsbQ [Sporosarcina sp. NCCP-2222]|uniref:alpha/beta fold hydrolase n=1 Tax=Sporosarcina sp. NCCP-2222 TaxID=2935073 RepID=UPI002089C271|nr:alpha/beta hydrolase [Sporosarcina sp. NCCP-2222]GKV56882.1 sigma factor SigB regulation protein RsbQ [Sporosarcina sp. NCCP-2222]
MSIKQRNHVTVLGNGEKTIVFAHGFGCDQTVWNRIGPAFEKDYRIVLFDYTGSGRSDKSLYSSERYSSLDGYALDLVEIADEMNLSDVIFVGHSVSSMIGAIASIQRPHLMDRLIMIGPSPHYMNDGDYKGGFEREDINELLDMMELNYKEWAKYLAPVVMKNEERPELASNFERTLSENDPVIARRFAEVTFTSDLRDRLAQVSVPTLILQTREDAISPIEVGEYVHEHIKGSEFVLMNARGHNPHISDPEETIQVIRDYLNGDRK